MNGAGIRRILVAGAGSMGSQIALVCALAGCEVVLHDLRRDALDGALDALRARTDRQVAAGRRDGAETAAAYDRITTTTAPTGDGVDLVIEAVVERLAVKRALFAELDAICPADTILASNSSSFLPSSMASAVAHPERFLNLHFFNPALVMKAVEVVRGPATADATVAAAVAFVERIGKSPIVLDREINGFVANRLLGSVRDEAIALLEGGYADIEAIDTAARTALGYPMGPFELMDLTGIDIGFHTKQARYEATGDPADRPSRTVSRLVAAGRLGRKTGRGFYLYDEAGNTTGKGI
ncbi:3-hydroxyacyl-CoA dehydrogenase [Tsukamurella ocularis]|uniref:3-hydroxyacyl-CoA dehydrogenase family protein n=1 Tax=Tsukamurella ocularis TaxID=1970234 RepID=UPI0039EEB7FF